MINKDLLDISRITNSPSISGGGYVIDAKQLNPDIEGTLANKIDNKLDKNLQIYTGQVNKTGIKDGDEVKVTVEIPISGLFLVEVDLGLCNAVASTKDMPFVTCKLNLNGNEDCIWIGARQYTSIPIAKIWDGNTSNIFAIRCGSGTIVATFKSYMGCQLSSEYSSLFKISFIPL